MRYFFTLKQNNHTDSCWLIQVLSRPVRRILFFKEGLKQVSGIRSCICSKTGMPRMPDSKHPWLWVVGLIGFMFLIKGCVF